MRFEFPRCREGKDETVNSRRAQTATLRRAPHRVPLFTSHPGCPVLSNRSREGPAVEKVQRRWQIFLEEIGEGKPSYRERGERDALRSLRTAK